MGPWDYFTNLANASETFQILLNGIFIFEKLLYNNLHLKGDGITMNIVLVMGCLTMTKLMTHLRVFDSLGMLVLLIS